MVKCNDYGEIIVFVISTQWRAFSTQFGLTLLQERQTHSRGGGLFEGGSYWRIYGTNNFILYNLTSKFWLDAVDLCWSDTLGLVRFTCTRSSIVASGTISKTGSTWSILSDSL